jgi:hypothetical protein
VSLCQVSLPKEPHGKNAVLDWHRVFTTPKGATLSFKKVLITVGPGWALLRWTVKAEYEGAFPGGTDHTGGATLLEIRDGKIVTEAMYLGRWGWPPEG